MKARAQSKWKPVKVSEPRKGRSRIFLNADLQKDVCFRSTKFSSVAQSCPTLCDPHGLQHTRLPCLSPTPRAYYNSCPSSQWCHPSISSSVIPFSSCLQSFPASWSFPMSQPFTSGDQSIGVSASTSVFPMNIQGLFPLGLTGLISLLSKRLSREFSNTTVKKHPFFSAQLSLYMKNINANI